MKSINAPILIAVLAATAVSPASALAAPAGTPSATGVGRAWGPVDVRAAAVARATEGGQGVGSAYGPITVTPSGARIAIGAAWGPIRRGTPCKRACTRLRRGPSRVRA